MSRALQLDDQLAGSRATLFWRELWSNAAHFPLANLLFEIVTEGRGVLLAPDAYVLVCAALAQAWMASGWERQGTPRPFTSNLIGPAVYVLLETLLEGPRFFIQPNHLIYVGFGVGIGGLRWLLAQPAWASASSMLRLIDGLSRGLVLLLMYIALEMRGSGSHRAFLDDASHQYIAMSLLCLGLLIGLRANEEERYRRLLQDVAAKLRRFSDWSLGRELTALAVENEAALRLRNTEVGVMFIDLRGFTAWADSRSPAEVVAMLNEFYAVVERAAAGVAPAIKIKFTADEALVVMADADQAVQAARAIRTALAGFLDRHGLGGGTGVHFGPTVQGLLGSGDVRQFDVIGDTVNVAKRLCDQAAAGEILVSEQCVDAARAIALPADAVRRQLSLRGKSEPVTVLSF